MAAPGGGLAAVAAEGIKVERRVSTEGTRSLTHSKSEFLDDRDLVATEVFEEGRVDPNVRRNLLREEPETLSAVDQGISIFTRGQR